MIGDASPEALTFVFADLESSTRLWERSPDAMSVAMERHDAILREAVERANGRVVKVTGAVLCTLAIMRAAIVRRREERGTADPSPDVSESNDNSAVAACRTSRSRMRPLRPVPRN